MKNHKLYKNIAFLLGVIITLILLSSCKKDPTPQPPTQSTIDTTKWQDQYINSGVLPDWSTSNNNNNNELVGTNWVLTKTVNGFATTGMNDTLHFINNTTYYINSDTTNKALYTLYTSQNNVTLTFKPFLPLNYMQCSTNQLGKGFASGKYIIGVEFVNLYNTVTTFKAWFTKI